MTMDAEQQQMNFMQGATPMEQFGANVTKLTNPEAVCEQIENNLRGVKKIKGKYIQFREKPYINETGINDLMGVVRSHISQNTTLSNLESKEIKGIMKVLTYTIGKMLLLNRFNYGIKNSDERTTIMDMILTPCFICLKRSYIQGERRFLKGAVYENVFSYPDMNQKKGGLNTFLHPFSRQ